MPRARTAWSAHVIAAYGAAAAKLDEIVPAATFSVLPGKRNVEREWAYLSQWC